MATPTAKWFLRGLLLTVVLFVVYDLTQQSYTDRYASGFAAIGIWAFGITAGLIGHLCLPSTRYRIRKATLFFVVYFGSYALLTTGGEYAISQSGRTRYSSGLSMSDVEIWHPRFLSWQPFQDVKGKRTFRGSLLGYFYSPLIAVDRYWLHPSQQLLRTYRTSD